MDLLSWRILEGKGWRSTAWVHSFRRWSNKIIRNEKGHLAASFIHAEAECLRWVMRETRKLGVTEVVWLPAFSQAYHCSAWMVGSWSWTRWNWFFLCSEFSSTFVTLIRRTDNVHADCFSKAWWSRTSNFCFFGDKVPLWLALEI